MVAAILGLSLIFVAGARAQPLVPPPEIVEFEGSDIPTEVAQIIQECNGFFNLNEEKLIEKRKRCQILALGLTKEALNNAYINNAAKAAGKMAFAGLKELAKAVAEPEEGLENLAEKAIEKAREEAEKRLKQNLKEFFTGNPDVVIKYSASGSVQQCSYALTVTWDVKAGTFTARTTGDCKCHTVTENFVGAKYANQVGKWQSTLKGKASLAIKADAKKLVRVLNVSDIEYSGAGDCNCQG